MLSTSVRTYIALDLETTGLNPEKDAILEVGAVKYRDGAAVEIFESLVNPARPIPYEITLITGIRNEDVIGKPTFDRIAPNLRQFIGSLPIVGQNVAFDLGFLRRLGLCADNVALDTWEFASVLVPGLPSYSLGSLAGHFGIVFQHQHRALSDATVTGQLFEILRERAAMLPATVLDEIARLAAVLRQWGAEWALAEVFLEAAGGRDARRVDEAAPPLAQVAPSSALFHGWRPGDPVEPQPSSHDAPALVDVDQLSAMLQPGGVFSDLFPGYEHRPQQVEMLCAVCAAFNSGHHLMAEAGTGTGKSLAYLLPAIAHAVRTGERVVVSTNTINLQDQLFQKDLPDLEAALTRAWGRRQPFPRDPAQGPRQLPLHQAVRCAPQGRAIDARGDARAGAHPRLAAQHGDGRRGRVVAGLCERSRAVESHVCGERGLFRGAVRARSRSGRRRASRRVFLLPRSQSG